jgi:hypothetical protein
MDYSGAVGCGTVYVRIVIAIPKHVHFILYDLYFIFNQFYELIMEKVLN